MSTSSKSATQAAVSTTSKSATQAVPTTEARQTINSYQQIMDKLRLGLGLTKIEKIKATKVGEDRLHLYAHAYEVASAIFPSRAARAKAIEEQAAILGTTVSNLNRTVRPDFQRPELQRSIVKTNVDATLKDILILQYALSVIGAGEKMSDAAIDAECSTRTMYRAVGDLLGESGLVTGDLKHMAMHYRSALANEIEKKKMPILDEKLQIKLEKAKKTSENRRRSTNGIQSPKKR